MPIGEIRLFAASYAPNGWAVCDGRLLPIADNMQLYKAVGPGYGGDGVKTFALPDMRNLVAIGAGPAINPGAKGRGGLGGSVPMPMTYIIALSDDTTMDAFIGEVRTFAFGFPPQKWVPCNGQSYQIAQNPNLFQVIGSTYGGDGQTVFSLPDLRGTGAKGSTPQAGTDVGYLVMNLCICTDGLYPPRP
jgi:microcystin-dependent protein